MTIFNHFRDVIVKELEELSVACELPRGLDFGRVSVEPPRDPSHGDISTNAAMVLSKSAGLKPRDLAERLAGRLSAIDGVVEVAIAGPGFVNLRLADETWHECLREILGAGRRFGESKIGGGRKVNVEYVSTNPTGPLTVGHARGAVYGDALASLLEKAGYTTSTMAAPRWTRWRARPICATGRPWARRSARFPRASIRATT
jgi:arginyl-tRNA synthetase